MLLVLVGELMKAPFFFQALESQANVGEAACAPIAAALHPSLASVGALLSFQGYAFGTYGGYLLALMMQEVAP